MKDIAAAVNNFGKTEISTIEKSGKFDLVIGGEKVEILADDVRFSQKICPDGWLPTTAD